MNDYTALALKCKIKLQNQIKCLAGIQVTLLRH